MITYQFFGSKTSIDYDVMLFVDTITNSKYDNNLLCKKYNEELSQIYPDKKMNCNLAILENGIITKVYKGTADECNNSLFLTYSNFEYQKYPNHIVELIPRDVELKILRCYRIICSMLSRNENRSEVKAALA